MFDLLEPRLLADIGGTHARFAIDVDGATGAIATLRCADYAGLAEAIGAYVQQPAAHARGAARVQHAAIAIANPVDGDTIAMTNHHWRFSVSALRDQLCWQRLAVVNDFEALALAVPSLQAHDIVRVGGGEGVPDAAIALLGAGTGLGASGLIKTTHGWKALQAEGGHVSFAPVDALEVQVLQYAWREHPHVSAERLLSGMGLELLYRALCLLRHGSEASLPLTAPEIIQRGLERSCNICDETIELFCRMLGTIAANLALSLGSRGGVYIGGGIVPRLGARFAASGFRARFDCHGRFSDYLAKIPVFVITAEHATLRGVATLLRPND